MQVLNGAMKAAQVARTLHDSGIVSGAYGLLSAAQTAHKLGVTDAAKGLYSVAQTADSLGVVDLAASTAGGPVGLGMVAAKWLLSSTLTSSVGALGASWAFKALLSHYGSDIAQGLYSTITTEMSKLPQRWGGAPKPPPPPLLSLQGAGELMGAAARHSRALFAVLLFLSVQYLHALGAYEMRRTVRARADTRAPTTSAKSPPQKEAPSQQSAFYTARAHLALANQDTLETRVTQEDASVFDGLLHSLYANHAFYAPLDPKATEAAYFTLSGNHPVRMCVNLLLGFSMQLNALLPFRGPSSDDTIAQAARVASVVAYFEMLMRALRLYGWAPLYVATSLVARAFAGAPAAGRKRNI